jgi:hypothetical protein
MSYKFCVGLIALPVFLWNAGQTFASSGVAIFKHQIPETTAFSFTQIITNITNIDYQLQAVPFQLSARDDQTEECLRAGSCKD